MKGIELEIRGWLAVFLVVFALFDVAGNVLAIVAIKVAVSSRKEDCQGAEVLRAQNRAKARTDRAKLSESLMLLHIKSSPKIVALADKQLEATLRQNRAVNCTRYANRALPW